MHIVNITPKTSILLSNTIAQLVNFYSKDSEITCIYMRCYTVNSYLNKESNIRIYLMYNNFSSMPTLKEVKKVTQRIKKITGINLSVSFCYRQDYQIKMNDGREYTACRELFNSKILFDRTGELIELQNQLSKQSAILNTSVTTNIEFEPPLKLKRKARNDNKSS